MKPIFEYCCSVWGNNPNDLLLRILRVQKRCSRLILDDRLLNNSAQMFQKLQWLPIDDIIRIKKLCMMFKIVNKECPVYFTSYRSCIKSTHSYNTRLSSNNALALPKCRSNACVQTPSPPPSLPIFPEDWGVCTQAIVYQHFTRVRLAFGIV